MNQQKNINQQIHDPMKNKEQNLLPSLNESEQNNKQINESNNQGQQDQFEVDKNLFCQILNNTMGLKMDLEEVEILDQLALKFIDKDKTEDYIYLLNVAKTLHQLKSFGLIINHLNLFPQEFVKNANNLITSLKQLQNIDIKVNLLKDTQIQEYLDQLAQSISNLCNLQNFQFEVESKGCNLEGFDMTYFLKSVSQLKNLNRFSLILKNFSKIQDLLEIVGKEIKEIKNLKNLQLYFFSNHIGSLDLNPMFKYLECQNNLISISLGFEYGDIQSKGIRNVMSYLQKLPHLKNLALQLRECKLGLEGGKAFKEGFQNLQQLEKLSYILKNSYMGKEGYRLVSDGFGCLIKLKQLEIITEDNLGEDYYEVLTQELPSLKKLIYARFVLHYYSKKKIFQRLMKSRRLVSIQTQ